MLSPKNKFFLIYSDNGRVLIYETKHFSFLKELKIPKTKKIISADISACENYLVFIFMSDLEKHPFVIIWVYF